MAKQEPFWAIVGKHGLYTGTWHTRSEAIAGHTRELNQSWKYSRSRGDRAIKITVVYQAPKT